MVGVLDRNAEQAQCFGQRSRVGIKRVAVEQAFGDTAQTTVSNCPRANKHAPAAEIGRRASLREFDCVFERFVEDQEVAFGRSDVIREA